MLRKNGLERFSVSFDRVGVRLQGESANWDDIVRAGLLVANKKSRYHVINDTVFTGDQIPAMYVPPVSDGTLEGRKPDVLVIGGGVVGCAIARELTKWKLDCMLIEKEHDVALGASGRNDGCIHPGIDLVRGTKKQKYNLAGNRMFDRISGELDFGFKRSGQILAFSGQILCPLLYLTKPYFRAMGLGRVRVLNRRRLHELEPEIADDLGCGLFFPTAGVVCPYNMTIAYAENAASNGAQISLDTAALGMEVSDGRIVSVRTNRGTVYPRVVINAAGVFSEEIARMAQDRFFSIHPRKGTNAILDKKARRIVRTSYSRIGSVDKSAHSKGGGIVGTVDGNVLVGPDAFETYKKEDVSTEAASIKHSFDKHAHSSAKLSRGDIITYFSGVRAATFEEDFIVEKGRATANIIHAAGIQSPGLTAAPAIAVEIERLCVAYLRRAGAVKKNDAYDAKRKGIPRLAEMDDEQREVLIQANPAYGEIICRCEEVSRGEIIDALHRPLPCDTVDGVKKRVRPGMGRCQGGFCSPLVTRIIAEETGRPISEIEKGPVGSRILQGETKAGVEDA